ncbi:MAG: hypothetical protein GY714_00045 [Desulfobacterales bacterium]|nr:hypothetical protein [Desulfobacterales bacterium]
MRNLSIILTQPFDDPIILKEKIIEIISLIDDRSKRWDFFKKECWKLHTGPKKQKKILIHDIFKIVMEYIGNSIELEHGDWMNLESHKVKVNIEWEDATRGFHYRPDWPFPSIGHTDIKIKQPWLFTRIMRYNRYGMVSARKSTMPRYRGF